MKNRRLISKAIPLILIGAMSVSMTGCGKQEPKEITDYAGIEISSDTEEAAPVSSIGDSEIGISGKSLHEMFGENLVFECEQNVGDMQLSAKVNKPLPDVDYLDVYELGKTRKELEDEKAFANGFFDDGATELPILEFKSDTENMALIHKYKRLLEILTQEKQGTYIVTPDTELRFGWEDNDFYSIHMYKGLFNGVDYGLILACDYVNFYTYIYFEPLDIDEYFPGENYSTMMLEEAQTPYTEPIENRCTLDQDAVCAAASEFLRDRVGLDDTENVIEIDNWEYSSSMEDIYNFLGEEMYFDTLTALTFSDSDYISTMHNYHTRFRGYDILRNQPDQLSDQIEESDETYYINNILKVTSMPDCDFGTNVTTDGYAVFLGSQFKVDPDARFKPMEAYINDPAGLVSSDKYNNTGIIKVTSKGIYGADLRLTGSITDKTEAVGLLDFEKVKESFIESLETAPAGHAYKVIVNDVVIDYAEQKSSENPDTLTLVPVWRFKLSSYFNDGSEIYTPDILINALDGSLVSDGSDLLSIYSEEELNAISNLDD